MSSKRRPLARVASQSGFYALGNVAIKLSGLVLAPYYLNAAYLSLADYGYMALLLLTAQIAIHTAGLGLSTGLLKFMTDASLAAERKALPFTALASSIVMGSLAAVLLWMNASMLSDWILDDGFRVGVFTWVALYVGAKVVTGVPMMMMRIQERAGLFSLAVAFEMAALIGGVHYFLGIQGAGLEGVFKAYAASAGISMLVLGIGMLTQVRWQFTARLVKPLIAFGSPLVVVGLAGIVLNAGDRFVLKAMQEASTVGMYEWAGRLSGVLNMLLVQSFQLAFTVVGLKTLGVGDHSLHRNAFRHYTIWGGWAVLAVSVFAYDVTDLLQYFGADAHYLAGTPLVVPLAIGFLIYGIYVIINNVLYAAWKTRVMSLNVVTAAIANIVLNIVLIPYLGAWGAAIATVISYSLLTFLGLRVAEREMPMNYPWGLFVTVIVLAVGLYMPAYFTQSWPDAWRWLAHAGIVLAYAPIALLLRLYTRADMERALDAVRAWRSGGTSGGEAGI